MNWYKIVYNKYFLKFSNRKKLAETMEQWISNRTGMPFKVRGKEDVGGLGKRLDFSDGQTVVETCINETPDQIILTIIQTKPEADRTATAKGTGKGTEVVKALKDYADFTGKQFVVPDTTSAAGPYWDKIDFLNRDYVPIPFDGKKRNIGDTFQYTPKNKITLDNNIEALNNMNSVKIAQEIFNFNEHDKDYTDIGHDRYVNKENKYTYINYMWAYINNELIVKPVTKDKPRHTFYSEFKMNEDGSFYSGRFDSLTKELSIAKPIFGPLRFKEIPENLITLLKQKFHPVNIYVFGEEYFGGE